MKFGRPRGTRDFLPAEMKIRRLIIDRIRSVFESHGFEEMDTPALELWEVLATKGGEEVERQIYKFQDKAGRWLGLRFDLTVPLARVIANMPDLPKPFKRYCISKVWRYEEPQSGRFREFVQADIDIVGSPRIEADVVCISTAVDALRGLGLEGFEVKVNNRKILEGMVETLGIDNKVAEGVFHALDRLDKVGESKVAEELEKLGIDAEKSAKLLEFTRIKGEEAVSFVEERLRESRQATEGIAELRRMIELADIFGLKGAVVVDFSLVRGLDYYTGPVFEVKAKTREIGSIAGGGRYDRLIEKFGGVPTPATGISLGVERLYEVLKEDLSSEVSPSTKVFVAYVNEALMSQAIRIGRELINMGIPSEIDLMGRKLGRQLEYADSRGIPFVLIVGPEEIKTGTYSLKDMKTNKEHKADLSQIRHIVTGCNNSP
ncbi:MAG: histidine--tRNA ligase [Candidatus Verstraetearchaeota archaeon]|nr:histidine--tRNA ligase [Candidatus Verstraetearchaeota archaeon]